MSGPRRRGRGQGTTQPRLESRIGHEIHGEEGQKDDRERDRERQQRAATYAEVEAEADQPLTRRHRVAEDGCQDPVEPGSGDNTMKTKLGTKNAPRAMAR